MNFTTKLSGYDVTTDKDEMEGAFSIEWDFYTEMRRWGVKAVGVYTTKVVGVIYTNDESVLETERIKINSEDKGWTIDTDTSQLEYGNSICPQDIYVDLKHKIISVNF